MSKCCKRMPFEKFEGIKCDDCNSWENSIRERYMADLKEYVINVVYRKYSPEDPDHLIYLLIKEGWLK